MTLDSKGLPATGPDRQLWSRALSATSSPRPAQVHEALAFPARPGMLVEPVRTPLLLLTLGLVLSACPGPTSDAGPDDEGSDAGEDGGSSDGGTNPSADAGPDPDVQPDPDPDAQPDPDPEPEHAPPTDSAIAYFSDISQALTGQALVDALHNKLSGDHVELSFASLFEAYETTDTGRCGPGIFDFYSDQCWQPDEACGQYSQEGDCWNREHSWPKSWWGGGTGPDQHQDLIAVIPADGFVNNARANLPLGTISNPNYTSSNGSRRGTCIAPGAPTATLCFEPTDDLKGDLARIYFYMAVRYEGDLNCCDEASVDGADLKAWQEELLRSWHVADPVDLDERERNERVFGLQQTRNPFVDYPAFVGAIDDF